MPKKVECDYCKKKFGCKLIIYHYEECIIKKHINDSGFILRFFSHGIFGNIYFIYAIVGLKCDFMHIDSFLRKKWCECCNHLSFFTNLKNNEKISKTKKIIEFDIGDKFIYKYDMGSTTTIYCEILGKMEGIDRNNKINILKQNDKQYIICSNCNKKYSEYIIDNEAYCKKCVSKIDDETDIMLNIVNSPRTGICGYQ